MGWDEALDYTAERLKEIMARHGSKSVLFRTGADPFRDLHQALVRGLGSPNYSNHDSSCARNVMHAAQSLFGFGRKDVVYDLKNARHVVLQTRNIFESINVKEANDLMTAIGQGCKLTVIDIRANLTAMKADRFFLVRPGTDYALNLAVIHELLSQRLHDMKFTRACTSKTSDPPGPGGALHRQPGPRKKPELPPSASSSSSVIWPQPNPRSFGTRAG